MCQRNESGALRTQLPYETPVTIPPTSARPSRLRGLAIVEPQQPPETLSAHDGALGPTSALVGPDELSAQSLVEALPVIVLHEGSQRPSQMGLTQGHDAAQAFRFGGQHEPLSVRVGRSRQLHPMVTVRIDVSESPTPSIRSSDANST